MASLSVKPEALSAAGGRVAAAAAHPGAPSVPTPVATDPVSVSVAATLAARAAAVHAHSTVAAAVTAHRGAQLQGDAGTYTAAELANAAVLGGAGNPAAVPAGPGTPALPPLPDITVPTVAAPVVADPPADGKTIATLIHRGGQTEAMVTAADWLTRHARDLDTTATALHTSAADLDGDWSSPAATQATTRIRELGTWHSGHAEHARSAAAAIDEHLQAYGTARAAIPTPEQFDDNERRLRMAVAANNTPGSLGRYTPVINALVAQRAELNAKAVAGYTDYAASAGPAVAGAPQSGPPKPGGEIRKFSGDAPQAPGPKELPHGQDPRYWLDLDKIIHVPPGQLAPYGTKQIGPGLYYPDPGSPMHPNPTPPGVAKHPLDFSDVVKTGPGGLGPSGYEELAPGWWAPSTSGANAGQPWSAPQTPIDVRDVIQVPPGQLAPNGYIQYLPGWWAPGPSAAPPASTRP